MCNELFVKRRLTSVSVLTEGDTNLKGQELLRSDSGTAYPDTQILGSTYTQILGSTSDNTLYLPIGLPK